MAVWAIRTHLLLLVVAVSAPLGAVVGYGIYNDMQQSVAHSKDSLRTLANTMVSNTGGKIANARALMEHLAARPQMQQLDPRHCDKILQEMQSLKLGYSNVATMNLQGQLVCSALPQPDSKHPVEFANAPWFAKFIQEKRFTVGNPVTGPVSGKWISILSVPIWNAKREMVGAVLLGFDLKEFDPNISTQFLPDESRYGFFAEDGIMVWRNSDPEGVIGSRPNADAARRIVEMKDGEFESLAVDGVVRFFSVVPMPQTGWTAFVGVPAATVYAPAKQRAITATGIALAALVFLVLIAATIARRIARPVADLEKTARAVHGGDLGVRAPLTGPREVAEVAAEFNTMIDALQHSDAQLRIAAAAFESHDGMVVTNAQGVVLRCNRAFSEITGYAAHEVVGRDMKFLRSGRHDADFYAEMWLKIKIEGAWHGQIWNRIKNGEVHPYWLTISAVRGNNAQVSHYVGALTDITERHRREEQVRQMAFYDTLTQLPNRRLLNDRLGQAMATSKRCACYGALMFLDLDNFKPLNDTHGHAVGDLLLMEVARRLRSCVREVDTVARIGGDEFVVVLGELDASHAKSIEQASASAEKIRLALSTPYVLTVKHEGVADTVIEHQGSASIGVALFLNHDTSQEDVLTWADQAMYQAKQAGRNVVCFHNSPEIPP